MIENCNYPLHHEGHEILPSGLKLKKSCPVCEKGVSLIENKLGYRVYILNKKLCLEGPDGICCSDTLTTCPKCGRRL